MAGWTDFITNFMTYTDGIRSPRLFRLWSAISVVSGALERRVWLKAGRDITFASQYIVLVAPPGIGKQVIDNYAKRLWEQTKLPDSNLPAFHVSSDSLTHASLIDELAAAERTFLPPTGSPVTYHSLQIAAEELIVLMPAYDLNYVGKLNGLWNNKETHSEARRHGPAREINITKPQLNILAGVQPNILATMFPDDAWQSGFARRLLMIYCDQSPFVELFEDEQTAGEQLKPLLLDQLSKISQLYGQCTWSPEARDHLADWHRSGELPKPNHPRLNSYCQSRMQLVLKLTMVSVIARSGMMKIEVEDTRRALAWLLEAEESMPDIFRAMVGRSDTEVLDELHFFMMKAWAQNRRQPIRGELIRQWLLKRVTHEKVEPLMDVADRAKIIARVAGGDSWMPCPRDELGTIN